VGEVVLPMKPVMSADAAVTDTTSATGTRSARMTLMSG
jgi:hypothetical protein